MAPAIAGGNAGVEEMAGKARAGGSVRVAVVKADGRGGIASMGDA